MRNFTCKLQTIVDGSLAMDHRLSAMHLLTTYNLLLTTSMSINKLQYISQSSNSLSHLAAIESALKAGCKWVQLRVKNETQVKVLEIAKLAKILCDRYKAKLIINDNPEVAKEVKAYGVQLFGVAHGFHVTNRVDGVSQFALVIAFNRVNLAHSSTRSLA